MLRLQVPCFRESIFIQLMKSGRKLGVSREGSECRKYGTKEVQEAT